MYIYIYLGVSPCQANSRQRKHHLLGTGLQNLHYPPARLDPLNGIYTDVLRCTDVSNPSLPTALKGLDNSFAPLALVERFDPLEGTWETLRLGDGDRRSNGPFRGSSGPAGDA